LRDLARESLANWQLPKDVTLKLVNVSENTTYRLDDRRADRGWALRLHRLGYHSLPAIRSELAWAAALRSAGVALTPVAVRGNDGELVQSIGPRHCVLFEWESGSEPTATDVPAFMAMGEAAARMHEHARLWPPPPGFVRHTWDFEASLGARPRWGRWQDGIGVTPEMKIIFSRTIELIERRLSHFGQDAHRFGLIHGDMRLANLLLDGLQIKILDFDDCGWSWFLYDCATTVSFFEHSSEVPSLIDAWVKGYRRIRPLPIEDEAEIPTFVMLRRLLLVAWLGSHRETELARTLGADYSQGSIAMCEDYLRRMAR